MRPEIVLTSACFAFVSSGAPAGEPIVPLFELQSEPLTPGLVLDESRRPVHQIRLLAEVGTKAGYRGTMVLDPNVPEFDEFGGLVGGLQTPYVQGKGGALPMVELGCAIEFLKAGPEKWLLYRVRGPGITSALLLATRGHLSDGAASRLLVLDGDKKVKAVVGLTWFGHAVP